MRLCNSPIRNSFPLKKDIHIKITHEKWQLKNYFLHLLFHVIQVITIILTYSTYVFNYLEEKSKIKKKKKDTNNMATKELFCKFNPTDHNCCAVLGRIQLFAISWTVISQAPLSMGILQARILEWVAMPSSSMSS